MGLKFSDRRWSFRAAAFLLASTALTCGSLASLTPANAQTAQTSYAIPGGSLNRVLAEFGRQSGLQIVYVPSIAAGKSSPGVSGAASPAQAIARILQGTGLTYSFPDSRTVSIAAPSTAAGGAAPAGAISLDTIDVQGETAWGPVNGFVASRSATATKTDTPIIEVPQSISVVTRDQMQTRQVQSLNETLKYTPGVFAEFGGIQSSAPSFVMRGFNTSGSIYLNGLRTVNYGDIEPYGLERVEVMRGPASVLYGQNQPSGVIGLVTKRPTEQAFHEVRLQGGSFAQRGGAFDLGGPANDDKTLLYRFTGLMREGGNGIDFSNDRRAFLSGGVTWRPTAATEITAFSHYQKDDGRWNYGLPAQGTALPNPNGRIPVTRLIGELAAYNITERAVVGYNLQHRAQDNLIFRQNCSPSARMRQIEGLSEGRISGSS